MGRQVDGLNFFRQLLGKMFGFEFRLRVGRHDRQVTALRSSLHVGHEDDPRSRLICLLK